jgi:hypothetical protein
VGGLKAEALAGGAGGAAVPLLVPPAVHTPAAATPHQTKPNEPNGNMKTGTKHYVKYSSILSYSIVFYSKIL